MKHTHCTHENFWFLYKMINFSHSFHTKKKCPKCKKKIQIHFRGEKKMHKNFILRVLMTFFWLAPVFVIIFLTSVYIDWYPWNYFFAVVAVTLYHFAAMYYIIRGPYLKVDIEK